MTLCDHRVSDPTPGMLDSDPVLQEISASLRSQRLPERPANTNKTNSSFMV